MSQQVHARFRLAEDGRVESGAYDENRTWVKTEALRVKLYPVPGDPYGSATSTGSLEMVIANPEAIPFFKNAPIGQEYDVVFSLVATKKQT